MALWLQEAIEDRGCEGQGCPGCRYQIYNTEETWACVGDDRWRGYNMATELWWLLGQLEKGKRLQEIIGEMEEDEDEILLMTLAQIKEAVSLFSGLDRAVRKFVGNIDCRFHPDEVDWDLEEYSNLITHWKNPDGTDVYTLINALSDAEETESYLRGALKVGKPVQFE